MWHFTASDRILRYGDGREVIAGKTLSVDGEPELCTRGLHACKNILDACGYAPGPYIWWVELSGKVIHDGDKSVGTRRKAVWGYDATEVLREFTRVVALKAVEKYWDASKSWAVSEVVDLIISKPATNRCGLRRGLRRMRRGMRRLRGLRRGMRRGMRRLRRGMRRLRRMRRMRRGMRRLRRGLRRGLRRMRRGPKTKNSWSRCSGPVGPRPRKQTQSPTNGPERD